MKSNVGRPLENMQGFDNFDVMDKNFKTKAAHLYDGRPGLPRGEHDAPLLLQLN